MSFDSLYLNKVLLCFDLPTLYHCDFVIAHNGDEPPKDCRNEPSGSIKCGEGLDQLSNYKHMDRNGAPWSSLVGWMVHWLVS